MGFEFIAKVAGWQKAVILATKSKLSAIKKIECQLISIQKCIVVWVKETKQNIRPKREVFMYWSVWWVDAKWHMAKTMNITS